MKWYNRAMLGFGLAWISLVLGADARYVSNIQSSSIDLIILFAVISVILIDIFRKKEGKL